MEIHVISLIYVDKRDTGINFQSVGFTLDEAISSLNTQLNAYWDELYEPEDREELDVCGFVVDGAWADGPDQQPELPLEEPEPRNRETEVRNQLDRWLHATMDAFIADYTKHTLSQ